MTWGQFVALDEDGQRKRMQVILAGWQRNTARQANDDCRLDAEEERKEGWAMGDRP